MARRTIIDQRPINARSALQVALLAALGLAAPLEALAQDDGATTEAPAAAEEEKATADPSPGAYPGAANDPFPRIADREETIFAVQRKAFLTEGKWELTPYFAASVADRFVTTFAPAGSVVYHLTENFGLEVYGSYMFPTESALTEEILNNLQLRSDISKLTQMLWTAGVGVQWSPIYGKIQILGEWLGNFSFYFGAGVGVGETRVQCTNGLALDPNRGFPTNANGETVCNPNDIEKAGDNPVYYEPNTFRPMAALSGGVRFDFLTWLALKVEVKNYIFVARVYRPDDEPELADSVRNNIFVNVGVSFLLGGEEN